MQFGLAAVILGAAFLVTIAELLLPPERFRTQVVALFLLSVALGASASGLHPEADRRTIGRQEVMRMADSSMNIDAPSTSVA